MANKILNREQAEYICRIDGYEKFIDQVINEKIIIIEQPKDEQLFCHRKFKDFGDISLEYNANGNKIELWINGRRMYRYG